MVTFLTILMIITCILLVLIVLIQNPKGGGLSSGFGGLSNQVLGVKRTTDFLEKGTWTLAIALLVFSLSTNFFIPKEKRGNANAYKSEVMDGVGKGKSAAPAAPTTPPPAAPAAPQK